MLRWKLWIPWTPSNKKVGNVISIFCYQELASATFSKHKHKICAEVAWVEQMKTNLREFQIFRYLQNVFIGYIQD